MPKLDFRRGVKNARKLGVKNVNLRNAEVGFWSLIFGVSMTIIGSFPLTRQFWAPFMAILGAYLLIDGLEGWALKFEPLPGRRKIQAISPFKVDKDGNHIPISPGWAYSGFILIIVLTALGALAAQRLVQTDLDPFIPLWLSSLFWSWSLALLVGIKLNALYKEKPPLLGMWAGK